MPVSQNRTNLISLAGEHFMLKREADLQSKFRRQNYDIK